MPLRVLIIPDKFKGTLTAAAAAEAIARGWRKARPEDSLDLLPMSDGGDGFGEVTSALLEARIQRVKTVDAAHRPCLAKWWWEPRTADGHHRIGGGDRAGDAAAEAVPSLPTRHAGPGGGGARGGEEGSEALPDGYRRERHQRRRIRSGAGPGLGVSRPQWPVD